MAPPNGRRGPNALPEREFHGHFYRDLAAACPPENPSEPPRFFVRSVSTIASAGVMTEPSALQPRWIAMKPLALLFVCAIALDTRLAWAQQIIGQVTNRNQQQLNLVWDRFAEQEISVFYNTHANKLFVPNGQRPLPFDSLPAATQQNIRWAAEDAGVVGNLEQALAGRHDARRPLRMRVLVGEGVEVNRGVRHHVPLSSVAQADRAAFQAVFREWSEKRDAVNRERQKVQALEEATRASRAAEAAAWAAVRAAESAESSADQAAFMIRSGR